MAIKAEFPQFNPILDEKEQNFRRIEQLLIFSLPSKEEYRIYFTKIKVGSSLLRRLVYR